MGEFAVVTHWSPVEDDGRSNYTVAFDTPTIPQHVAQGLFIVGSNIITSQATED